MDKIKYIVLFFLTFICLHGCYVISDEDLFEVYDPKIVVEAQINNLNQPHVVKISQSVNPNDSIISNTISNAIVIVSDNKGNSELLQMREPGIYLMNEIKGIPETEYSLSVSINDKKYSAVEVMPNAAIISKTEIKYIDKFVSESGNYIKLYILKVNKQPHYYKVEVTKNDSLYNSYDDLIIFDDAYSTDTIKYLVPYAFKPNDSVMIDLHAISSEMYRYHYELRKQTNNTFRNIQPPMQNPPSNIQSDVLGYFQVSAITRLNIVIK